MTSVEGLVDLDAIRVRGAAFGLLAGLLGSNPRAWDASELDALARALERLDAGEAIAALRALEPPPQSEEVRSTYARLFSQARVSPYECGHIPTGVGGHTGRLADIAGFYRAFGFETHGERPDHCAAELEFAAVVALVEHRAACRDDDEGVEICRGAWRAFLRDHLGGWLDHLADRIAELDPRAPHAGAARVAARLVDLELARLEIELAPVTGGLPVLDDDFELRCGDCPQVQA